MQVVLYLGTLQTSHLWGLGVFFQAVTAPPRIVCQNGDLADAERGPWGVWVVVPLLQARPAEAEQGQHLFNRKNPPWDPIQPWEGPGVIQ